MSPVFHFVTGTKNSENYRTASLEAADEVHVMQVLKEDYYSLVENGYMVDTDGNNLDSRLRSIVKNKREELKRSRVLHDHEVFSQLKRSSIEKLLSTMQFHRYQPGDFLCKQNELADRLFVMLSGSCSVHIQQKDGPPKKVAEIVSKDGECQVFGESAIESDGDGVRTATLIAGDGVECTTMEILAVDYMELVAAGDMVDKDGNNLDAKLRSIVTKNRDTLRRNRVLHNIPAFSKLKNTSINNLLHVMMYRTYKHGTYLCKQNEVADRLFVLLSGALHVDKEKDGVHTRVVTIESVLSNPPILGESSVIGDGTTDNFRTASLLASGEVTTMEVNKEDYFALVKTGKIEKLSPKKFLKKKTPLLIQTIRNRKSLQRSDVSPSLSPELDDSRRKSLQWSDLSPPSSPEMDDSRRKSLQWSDLSPPQSPLASSKSIPSLWGKDHVFGITTFAPGTGSCSPHSNSPPTVDNIQNNGDGAKRLLSAKQIDSYQTKLDSAVIIQESIKALKQQEKVQKIVAEYETQLSTWLLKKLKKFDSDETFRKKRIRKHKTRELFKKFLRKKIRQVLL